MIDTEKLFQKFNLSNKNPIFLDLINKAREVVKSANNGNLLDWLNILNKMPLIKPSLVGLNSSIVSIGSESNCSDDVRNELESLLLELHPWRKGPFDLFGIHIDSEWMSDLKWDRLKNDITSLKDKIVLDVGCSNGYHCLRMLGEGASTVMGIDPTLLYWIQFEILNHFVESDSVAVFPLGIDDMPVNMECFDTVFSMGLLYHRRAPLDHLLRLRSFLRDGGELVLETLVVDGDGAEVIAPVGRYAKMPNVWFIPTCAVLEHWLKRMGYSNIRLINVTKTTQDEQRVTKWMGWQSLNDFLDPNDKNKTVEGYPAPKRAIFICNK